MFVGSYNCVPVAVMEIKDCKTGAPVSRSADSPDASIVEQRRLVLTSVSQRRWGGVGPRALFCLLAAGSMIFDRSVGAAAGALLIGVAFATLPACLATEHYRQAFDPARGEITVSSRSWLYESETRYAVADFAGNERRRQAGHERAVLIGRRQLVLLNDAKKQRFH